MKYPKKAPAAECREIYFAAYFPGRRMGTTAYRSPSTGINKRTWEAALTYERPAIRLLQTLQDELLSNDYLDLMRKVEIWELTEVELARELKEHYNVGV